MSKRKSAQPPTLFSHSETKVKADRNHRDIDHRYRDIDHFDIQARTFFDAAYPTPTNVQNWGHLQPETIEDIFDPETLRNLQLASICEVLNDDALNGMINVGAESIIGRGCQIRVQCGLNRPTGGRGQEQYNKHSDLEQYIEYLWDNWFKSVRYAQQLRTGQKDLMILGSYYRRIIQNPHKKFGLDVTLVSPLRIQTPSICLSVYAKL